MNDECVLQEKGTRAEMPGLDINSCSECILLQYMCVLDSLQRTCSAPASHRDHTTATAGSRRPLSGFRAESSVALASVSLHSEHVSRCLLVLCNVA